MPFIQKAYSDEVACIDICSRRSAGTAARSIARVAAALDLATAAPRALPEVS